MTAPHDPAHEARQWIEKAENDRRNAEFVLTMEFHCPTDTICYHCQQCAEKYLKALLAFRGTSFPRTHDVILLANLVHDSSLDACSDDLHLLNRYSVETRYPGDWEPISKSEAAKAVESAARICSAVKNLLPPDAASPPSPGTPHHS